MKRILKRMRKHSKNILLFAAGACILFSGAVMIWISTFDMPDFHAFDERKMVNSTKIYDRTGEILLYDLHDDVRRTDITFEDMGSNIKNATVAIEDSEFYNHKGIRITSIIRAVLSNIFNAGPTQGGSTITQQLVKNSLLTQKKTIARKVKEWILAVEVDRSLPKEKILEYYLNEAPYGGNIYGIEEAAKIYFAKEPMDLTVAEAAYLASIPQSPTALSPYGKNRDRLEDRKNLVLKRMLEVGFLNQEQYEAAKNEIVAFQPAAVAGIRAPHFVFFMKEYLEEKYGKEAVEGGLTVISTIDYNLQEKGEKIVKEEALKNEKDWNGKNAALVAIDPKTGQILTMIGSRDYFDKTVDGNFNVATAKRQPGSSFKPFIYATAFNKGFTPSTVLFDVPTEFSTSCNAYGAPLPGKSQSSCYKPDNYDGKFRGPMSLRNALAQSINVPAVKLFYLSGMRDSLKTAEEMGISTLADIDRYGLTLVIGGGEVTLLDMTSAYSVFANDGVRNPYTGVLRVEDASGNLLEEYEPRPEETLPKNTALTISDILSDNTARTPTFGANSPLVVPGHDVAVKTGTTNNNKDAWTIGYTPSITVGVWAGNNDNKPMKKGGSAMAGPIWNRFISEALKDLPNESFQSPSWDMDPARVKPVLRGIWQGNDNFFVDSISGKLATDNTPKETMKERVITNVHSILYWVDRNDITGPPPSNPGKDPQFSHWETSVQNWWANNSGSYPITTVSEKPSGRDDIHTGEGPIISISEPNESVFYSPSEKIQLRVGSSGRFPIKKFDVFVNDVYLGSSDASLNFSFVPQELENMKEENTLRVIAYDSAYNRGEKESIFKVR